MNNNEQAFWSLEPEALFAKLHAHAQGLSKREAAIRLKRYGLNFLNAHKRVTAFSLFLSQFKSPLVFLLMFAALLSYVFYERVDSVIILTIIIASALLGFFQEKKATNAMEKLLALVKTKAMVLRDGKEFEIPIEKVVPGDILIFNAGDQIPADGLILESKDFFVDESSLTGEPFAIEKREGKVALSAPLNQRNNSVFLGSHVVSGTAKVLAATTGKATEFGKLSKHLQQPAPQTAFQEGIKRFGNFLMLVTLVLTVAIFAINVLLDRPVIVSFVFALALAVGLTPQLLPAIISINLAHGANQMAKKKVIVKRLSSIENFGSMNVLCVDKTGTLTKGVVELQRATDAQGNPSEKAHLFGYLNASFESGYTNPLDAAILQSAHYNISSWTKLDELPYDFKRKRISIFVQGKEGNLLLSKGAFSQMIEICTHVEVEDKRVPIASIRKELQERYEKYSQSGVRLLALAYRSILNKERVDHSDEQEMIFLGFLLFFDPMKESIRETITALKGRGVSLKLITGDNRFVASHVAKEIGLNIQESLKGEDLDQMDEKRLIHAVQETEVFAEIEPVQKERILLALRKSGAVVGFLGDGINDTAALHTADVGISVDSAQDVVREVADIVLLEKNLSVLLKGVEEGRRTFGNTMKYIFMATSANFGNMFSVAGASLFLSFLPLLPKQILLTNFLTDFPEMTIATDNVDKERLEKPIKWDIAFIRKFMLVFGLISSFFDFMTFGVLLLFLHANEMQFRTGWFLESVLSACVIVLIIRTSKPFYRSRPSRYLLLAVAAVIAVTLALPYTPHGALFGFVPITPLFLLAIGAILALYITSVEIAKRLFFR